MKQSFLSNLIGEDTYREIRHAKTIVLIITCIIVILFLLSFFVHVAIVSTLLNFFTGYSPVFIVYIAALICFFDLKVDMYEDEIEPTPKKRQAYKRTIVWGLSLMLLGVSAIYLSNRYKKHYAFECSTFLVDKEAEIYHLNYRNHCEIATEAVELIVMKGFEVEKENYTLCHWCKEWADDAKDSYEVERFYRK